MHMIHKWTAALLAVCLLLSFASCGKTKDSLHARFSALYESDALSDYLADPQAYADRIAGYALDDFAGTFAEADKFRSYSVEITVQNTNDFAVELLNLQMRTDKQGKNGVYFSLSADGSTIGLPADFTDGEYLYYEAIADASLSTQDVLQTLAGMGIECVFADASVAADDPAALDLSVLQRSSILYEP